MILLDTHVVVWMLLDERRLGRETLQIIREAWAADSVAVSTISFWEAGMLIQKGRLDLGLDLNVWRRDLLEQGCNEISVGGRIAVTAGLLSDIHGDPADRVIVATAIAGGHTLITADERILDWPGILNRLDAGE